MGPDALILVFWMLSSKPTFSLSTFTFIKRLFSSSSLSAIRVVSSAYLRLLIFRLIHAQMEITRLYKVVSLVVQLLKNLPAMQKTWVRFLSWEDPLEKEMATHSSILAWRIPWTEEPGGLQSMGSQRVRHDLATKPPIPGYIKETENSRISNYSWWSDLCKDYIYWKDMWGFENYLIISIGKKEHLNS